MLILALLPLIITGLVSNYILDSMRNELTTVTEQMGRITATGSANAVKSQIHSENLSIAALTAKLVDERISKSLQSVDFKTLSDIIGPVTDSDAYTLLLSDSGRLLVDKNGNVSDEDYAVSDDYGKSYIARSVSYAGNETGLLTYEGEMVYFAVASCKNIEASVVVILSEKNADAAVTSLRDSVLTLNETINNEINEKVAFGLTVVYGVSALAAVAAMIMALRFSNTITHPIENLTERVSNIGGFEDFDGLVTINTGDEIEALADSFNLMTQRLRSSIDELEKITIARQRAITEFELIKNIRHMAFPQILPTYLDRSELDIYGTTKNEDSNSFYDYFEIGTQKIALITAEVSGGGVSSAVMMIIAKTLMEQGARTDKSIDEILYTVNNTLFSKSKEQLSLSVFIGYLDIDSGDFEYANAGMPVPFIHRIGDDWDFLSGAINPVLAKEKGQRFKSQKKKLMPHDRLFIYSDGVVTSKSPEGEAYGTERLYSTLKHHDNIDIQELCDVIYTDVNDFSKQNPSCDITMMVAEYFGRNIIDTDEEETPPLHLL
jgi:sigma-B regulation protein RsbU (phosphoserine phosphatase)